MLTELSKRQLLERRAAAEKEPMVEVEKAAPKSTTRKKSIFVDDAVAEIALPEDAQPETGPPTGETADEQ